MIFSIIISILFSRNVKLYVEMSCSNGLCEELTCLLFIQSSHGYSMGAPDSSCTKMTPGMIF